MTTPKGGLPEIWQWRLGVLAIASALFMEFIDATALSTALPTLAKAFNAGPDLLKLTLTTYMLGVAVAVPASGWLARRLGARRVFVLSILAFLIGSALCAASASLLQLAAARLAQGLAAGLMTPVARVIVVDSAPPGRLVAAMAWFTTPALIGPLIGPSLSGFILAIASWRWIFLINVPVGLLGVLAVLTLTPRSTPDRSQPFDAGGFGLATLAIAGVVILADTLGLNGVSIWQQGALLLVTAGAAALYLVHARRVLHPILDLRLLKDPTFMAGSVGGMLFQMVTGAVPFLLPLLLQTGFGWSPLMFGLVTMAQTLGALMAKPSAAPLIGRIGYRNMLLLGNIMGSLLIVVPGLFTQRTPLVLVILALSLNGYFRSVQFTATNTVIFVQTPKAQTSDASALAAVLMQIAFCLGISAAGLLLHLLTAHMGGSRPFSMAFVILGCAPLLITPIYALIPSALGRSAADAEGAASPSPGAGGLTAAQPQVSPRL
jgi:EmrB/QacA subfamily drug resistance transporter